MTTLDQQRDAGRLFGYHETRAEWLFGFHHLGRDGHVARRDAPRPQLRYFGVENETEYLDRHTRRRAVQEFTNSQRVWIAAEDGSLRCGAEFISAPATMAVWQRWATTLEFPSAARVERQTGLHVHVSRSTLSRLTVAKLLRLSAAPDAQKELTRLARRAPTHYCRRLSRFLWAQGLWRAPTNHCSAINTAGAATVEFRLWKATLRAADSLTAIELADAMCTFAAIASAQHMTWREFIAWNVGAEKTEKSVF